MNQESPSVQVLMSQEDLERMNRVLRHRLRNFISGIKTSISLVSQEVEGQVSPEVAEYFPLITRECESLEVLTSRLAFVFDSVPPASVTAVQNCLLAACETVKAALPAADIRVEVDRKTAALRIAGDPLVATALAEVIRNACEAAPRDSVTVSVAAEAGRSVMVRVSDRGPGVAADMHEKIFLPFLTTKSKHIGVGLTIARRFISAAGGSIKVADNGGRGFALEVTVPVSA